MLDCCLCEYADSPEYTPGKELVEVAENTVMLRTFSKIYGLAALRLGWGYFPFIISDVLNRVRSPFNVSAAAQAAGIAALSDHAHLMRAKNITTPGCPG